MNTKWYKIFCDLNFACIIFWTFCILGCASTFRGKCHMENTLLTRVEAYYAMVRSEKYAGSSYDYILPQWRQLVSKDHYLRHLMITEYEVESVALDGEIAEVVMLATKYYGGNKVIDRERFFALWGFTNGNWYLIDDSRIMPYSSDEISRFGKLMREGIPPEVMEEWKKNNPMTSGTK